MVTVLQGIQILNHHTIHLKLIEWQVSIISQLKQ